MVKKEEANDIIQSIIPKLNDEGILVNHCKIDTSTKKTESKRGDIWISQCEFTDHDFEEKIVALIEAKHKNCNIGDIEWRDAMNQGKLKAEKQGLNYYIVTNGYDIRFYNRHNDEEIYIDGRIATKFVPIEALIKIQTQVTEETSEVNYKSKQLVEPFTEASFRKSLRKLANVYRAAGLKKGDGRIDPTVSFVIMKYISEKESEERTLHRNIKLWNEFRGIAYEEEIGDLKAEFITAVNHIWGRDSQYRENVYSDFKNLINFSSKLTNENFISIYKELDKFHFHGGARFDLFGTIYEEFANQSNKKEFGEFYTRRHITGTIARLLLRNEKKPRDLKIADTSCGTGGFLTEAFKTLLNNYTINNTLNDESLNKMRRNIFYGFDNEPKSIARTKLNMFLVGDGHTNIHECDTLVNWKPAVGWTEDTFDYVLTNPPMGDYEGAADIGQFVYTNEKKYQLMFMERIINATKAGGEIAVVMDDGPLETPSRKNFRKKLLENCNIHAVVSLTKFAFAPYTKEKTYVLFMQKKQKDEIGTIQETPIWNYIVDYDGYANSDNRYKTKYHDDLPELEEKFIGAMNLLQVFKLDPQSYRARKNEFERKVNEKESAEGLSGSKFRFVEMTDINETNMYNLLSEFHLRGYEYEKVTIEEMEKSFNDITKEIADVLKGFGGNSDDNKKG